MPSGKKLFDWVISFNLFPHNDPDRLLFFVVLFLTSHLLLPLVFYSWEVVENLGSDYLPILYRAVPPRIALLFFTELFHGPFSLICHPDDFHFSASPPLLS